MKPLKKLREGNELDRLTHHKIISYIIRAVLFIIGTILYLRYG